MIAPEDRHACHEAIRHGSHSFFAASKLLPAHVREPALALYAFCRFADDEVDLTGDKARAVAALQRRLDRVYQGAPENAAPDRAFTAVVEAFDLPRALPDALIEGLDWDARARRYDTLSDLTAYSARVASAVGVMMCVLMGVRDREILARACDLGVAMQLTNIARDVGEDAFERRLYLPVEWLDKAGIEVEAFFSNPRPIKPVRHMVRQLLRHADWLYARSEAGIGVLPHACRPGIFAARFIYAGIGARLQAAEYDPISARAYTSRPQKLQGLAWAVLRSAASTVTPSSPLIYAPPLPETAFLVDAAAQERPSRGWGDTVTDALSSLAQNDQRRRVDPS